MRPPRMKPASCAREERLLPLLALRGRLELRQRARDAPAHVVDRALVALRVFLEQHVLGDGLRGELRRVADEEIVELHGKRAFGGTIEQG